MKYILLILILLVIFYVAFVLVRTYQDIRIGTALSAKAQPFERAEGRISMLVLGDSTAVGVGADTPSHSLAGYLSDDLDASVENYAVSGAVTTDVPAQMLQAKKDRYDLILIQVGANDVIRMKSLSQAEDVIDSVLFEARKRSDHVVLLTAGKIGEAGIFPWFIKPLMNSRAADLREKFMATADKNGVAYVDIFAAKDNFDSDPGKYYAADGLHLSADGWHFWYQLTIEKITTTWPEFVHAQ